jgi:hypothetical protein
MNLFHIYIPAKPHKVVLQHRKLQLFQRWGLTYGYGTPGSFSGQHDAGIGSAVTVVFAGLRESDLIHAVRFPYQATAAISAANPGFGYQYPTFIIVAE